jgi:hypothetical protein
MASRPCTGTRRPSSSPLDSGSRPAKKSGSWATPATPPAHNLHFEVNINGGHYDPIKFMLQHGVDIQKRQEAASGWHRHHLSGVAGNRRLSCSYSSLLPGRACGLRPASFAARAASCAHPRGLCCGKTPRAFGSNTSHFVRVRNTPISPYRPKLSRHSHERAGTARSRMPKAQSAPAPLLGPCPMPGLLPGQRKVPLHAPQEQHCDRAARRPARADRRSCQPYRCGPSSRSSLPRSSTSAAFLPSPSGHSPPRPLSRTARTGRGRRSQRRIHVCPRPGAWATSARP